jgi:type II secretory pathway component PulF
MIKIGEETGNIESMLDKLRQIIMMKKWNLPHRLSWQLWNR